MGYEDQFDERAARLRRVGEMDYPRFGRGLRLLYHRMHHHYSTRHPRAHVSPKLPEYVNLYLCAWIRECRPARARGLL